MKAFTISTTLALLTSLVSAAPAPAGASAPYQIGITFIGAADAKFTQYFLTNGYGSGICKPLYSPPCPASASPPYLSLQKE